MDSKVTEWQRFDSHFDLAGHAAYTLRWNAFRVKGQYPLTWANPPQRGVEGAKRYFRATSRGLREARETRHALMNLWRGVRELCRGRL